MLCRTRFGTVTRLTGGFSVRCERIDTTLAVVKFVEPARDAIQTMRPSSMSLRAICPAPVRLNANIRRRRPTVSWVYRSRVYCKAGTV